MKKVGLLGLSMGLLLLSGCGLMKDIEKASKSLPNSEFSIYKSPIMGTTVNMAASKYTNRNISIYVKTGVNQDGYYVQTAGCYTSDDDVAVPSEGCKYVSASDMKDQSDQQHYVNPTGTFNSEFFKDENGDVKLMIMDQQ